MFALKHIRSMKNNITKLQKIPCARNNISNVLMYSQEHLKVNINGEELQFPYVWLRDNCQCDKCYHYSAKSRILDWSYFDPDIKPKEVFNNNDGTLKVTWPDGHASKYNYDWLKFRSFAQKYQDNYSDNIYKPKQMLWQGNEFQTICNKYNYNDIINTDEVLYHWLDKLSIFGVALIENAPNSEAALDAIVDKIGFTKRTHYGNKYIVQNVPDTNNVAYLSSKLQMHTDLPYYEYCPGVNLLHYLVQTESKGGHNLLSDCHYVAKYMKENHPEEYRLLTEVEVEWSDVGTEDGLEFFKLHRSPIIALDTQGRVAQIRFSIPQRGSHFPGPIEDVVPWYKAHSLFYELSHKFAANFKNKEGNILVFDNMRLLHGRAAYEDNGNNVRKLIGAFIDWDEIYSRLRCLNVKFSSDSVIYK